MRMLKYGFLALCMSFLMGCEGPTAASAECRNETGIQRCRCIEAYVLDRGESNFNMDEVYPVLVECYRSQCTPAYETKPVVDLTTQPLTPKVIDEPLTTVK